MLPPNIMKPSLLEATRFPTFKKDTTNEEEKHYLNTLNKSTESLHTILNDILDLSQIESAKLHVRSEPLNIVEELDNVVTLFSSMASERGLALTMKIDPILPTYILGDPVRLKQILSNLVNNAIKFTKKGSILVYANQISNPNSLKIKIGVQDTGPGITENDKKKLFKPFSQVDSSTKKEVAGSGLGLSISQGLVKLMGGKIAMTSYIGEGSNFYFTLPLIPTEQDKPKKSTSLKLFDDPQRLKSVHILSVEDNEINKFVKTELFKRMGLLIDTVPGGGAALKKLKSSTAYDIVFMDCHMPEMNGYETTEAIRKLDLDPQPVIVALSADAFIENQKKCFESGMNFFLAKPIKFDLLKEMVGDIITKSAS